MFQDPLLESVIVLRLTAVVCKSLNPVIAFASQGLFLFYGVVTALEMLRRYVDFM